MLNDGMDVIKAVFTGNCKQIIQLAFSKSF